jgi:hypothetical protein
MLEPAEELGFAFESAKRLLVRDAKPDDLDRDSSRRALLLGLIDAAHPALANERGDADAPEISPNQWIDEAELAFGPRRKPEVVVYARKRLRVVGIAGLMRGSTCAGRIIDWMLAAHAACVQSGGIVPAQWPRRSGV